MLKKLFFYISAIIIVSYFSACTPVTRTTQSQQTWNEYKGKGKKSVRKGRDYRDRNNKR
ncbi:hypothetical protein [Marivirga lumbricoides]|uniref:hypothetical protein n=1 Tax=Marivirga lumbricoides TaxID=1046115 RepID=UPI0016637980